jgi:hypothetical protein
MRKRNRENEDYLFDDPARNSDRYSNLIFCISTKLSLEDFEEEEIEFYFE